MTIRFPRASLSVSVAALSVSCVAALTAGQTRDDVRAELPQVRPVVVWQPAKATASSNAPIVVTL